MQEEVTQEWWWAVQKKNEDVHQYALRLISIYRRLKKTPTHQDRIDRLATGVVTEIRNEARWFIELESDQWDEWIAFYNRVEKGLPARAANLRRAKKQALRGNQDLRGSSRRPKRGRGPPGRRRPLEATQRTARRLLPGSNGTETVSLNAASSAGSPAT